MKNVLILTISLALMLLTVSCTHYASEKNLDCISLNMNKEDVIKNMKCPGVARGSILNKYGQIIEVREYKIDKGKSGARVTGEVALSVYTLGLASPLLFGPGELDTYWLFFCDGRLVQWGKAGDWAEAQRQIYDINFNVTHR